MHKYAIISMDLEDWYHSHFAGEDVDRSVSLLDGLAIAQIIMKEEDVRGSFFVVGELAEPLKDKLRIMESDGHDLGCHGWSHIRPLSMSVEEFTDDLYKSKEALEHALGHEVSGYRAPLFGIDDKRLEIVKNAGFKYDSSKLKPQKSSKYGVLTLKGFKETSPCIYEKDGFTEFEVSTQKIGPMNMLLGGGYIRMLPWFFMKWMTKRYLKSGKPYVLYIHPIDLSHEKMPHVPGMGIDKYLRTHIGRRHMAKRFRKVIELLKEEGYEFVTFEELRKINEQG